MAPKLSIQHVVIGAGVVAFAVLVVWLIRSEGERTRAAMHDATQEAAKEVRGGLVEGAERAVEKAAELPGEVIRDVKDEVSDEAVETAERAVDKAIELPGKVLGSVVDVISDTAGKTKPQADHGPVTPPERRSSGQTASAESPPSVPPAAADPAVGKTTPPPETIAKAPERETPATPGDVVEEMFKLGHRVTKTLDDIGQQILELTPQEEMDLGREVHEFVLRDQKLLRSPALLRRLQNLAEPMLRDRRRTDIKYSISILDDSAINAFAHVGGYLYVTKGMIEFTPNDAELQFVLGHEIGHVDLKHCSKQASYVAKARQIGGNVGGQLALIAYKAIALGYSEEQEFEADEYGFRAFTKAGRAGESAVVFLRRMKKHFDAGGGPQAVEGDDAVATTIQQIQDHFQSHPPTTERILRLERLMSRSDAAP